MHHLCSSSVPLTLTVALAVTMHECWYPADTVEVSRASVREGSTAAAASATESRSGAPNRMVLLLALAPVPDSDFPSRFDPEHTCRENRCAWCLAKTPKCRTARVSTMAQLCSSILLRKYFFSFPKSRRKKDGPGSWLYRLEPSPKFQNFSTGQGSQEASPRRPLFSTTVGIDSHPWREGLRHACALYEIRFKCDTQNMTARTGKVIRILAESFREMRCILLPHAYIAAGQRSQLLGNSWLAPG